MNEAVQFSRAKGGGWWILGGRAVNTDTTQSGSAAVRVVSSSVPSGLAELQPRERERKKAIEG